MPLGVLRRNSSVMRLSGFRHLPFGYRTLFHLKKLGGGGVCSHGRKKQAGGVVQQHFRRTTWKGKSFIHDIDPEKKLAGLAFFTRKELAGPLGHVPQEEALFTRCTPP